MLDENTMINKEPAINPSMPSIKLMKLTTEIPIKENIINQIDWNEDTGENIIIKRIAKNWNPNLNFLERSI